MPNNDVFFGITFVLPKRGVSRSREIRVITELLSSACQQLSGNVSMHDPVTVVLSTYYQLSRLNARKSIRSRAEVSICVFHF